MCGRNQLVFLTCIHAAHSEISREMENFDGKDFNMAGYSDTELDKISHSYNEMLANIEQLVGEIKKQEKELRSSELHVLINQINPHFL